MKFKCTVKHNGIHVQLTLNNMLDKALKTNSTQAYKDYAAEPNWNINKLKKDIALLEIEIENDRHGAFGVKTEKYDFILVRTGYATNSGTITTGLDIDLLNSKISRLNSMNERLKSLELLKK